MNVCINIHTRRVCIISYLIYHDIYIYIYAYCSTIYRDCHSIIKWQPLRLFKQLHTAIPRVATNCECFLSIAPAKNWLQHLFNAKHETTGLNWAAQQGSKSAQTGSSLGHVIGQTDLQPWPSVDQLKQLKKGKYLVIKDRYYSISMGELRV